MVVWNTWLSLISDALPLLQSVVYFYHTYSVKFSMQTIWIRNSQMLKKKGSSPSRNTFVSGALCLKDVLSSLKWKGITCLWSCLCLFWENSSEDKHCQRGHLGSRDRTRTLGLLRAGNFVLGNGNKASKVEKEIAK